MEKKQCDSGDLGDKDLSRWFHHSGLVREKRGIGNDMSKVHGCFEKIITSFVFKSIFSTSIVWFISMFSFVLGF